MLLRKTCLASCLLLFGLSLVSSAAMAEEGSVGASVNTGSAGVGATASLDASTGVGPSKAFYANSLQHFNLEAGATVSPNGTIAPVGNVGFTNLILDPRDGTGGMLLSDPMLLHSNGVHGFAGADPLFGVGWGAAGKTARFTISPKLMLIKDFRYGDAATSVGLQSTIDVNVTDKLRLAGAGIVGVDFMMGRASADYKVQPNVALSGGVEVSDFQGVTSVEGSPKKETTAVMTSFGVKAVF